MRRHRRRRRRNSQYRDSDNSSPSGEHIQSCIMKRLKEILMYLWCLPQNLLGLLLRVIYKGHDSSYEDAIVRRSTSMNGGISLGKYIIVSQWASKMTIKHEYGHCRQSKRLGWFYLLVIGLPSILHAWLCRCRHHSYHDFYTARWADRLGGVNR